MAKWNGQEVERGEHGLWVYPSIPGMDLGNRSHDLKHFQETVFPKEPLLKYAGRLLLYYIQSCMPLPPRTSRPRRG